MKVKKRLSGRLDIVRTLDTMEINDTWRIKEGVVNVKTLRAAVSNYSRIVNKSFTVNSPSLLKGTIIVTRTK